jgi:hypothetical protein
VVLASNLDPRRKRELLLSLASRDAFEAALAQHAQQIQDSPVKDSEIQNLGLKNLPTVEEKEHV